MHQPLHFSTERSKTWDQLKPSNYDAHGIIYKRDECWNVSATIPRQASVLVMSSKLDPQKLHMYAAAVLESLDGDNKELVTCDYSVHVALLSTPLNEENSMGETCGMKIFTSYIKSEGDWPDWIRCLDPT
ncbi:hypothetical protein L917_14585 [Phytophthora nicotianae]|uniref:Uncharacterized protein n=3 Tax=Phytophthora nicotianae TaxID=4792 RepID=W2R2Q4_PHYN3|nr:hypothetical protein PPTG_04417 [Phytophthora nicotianae INRA-310]ETI39053.1 hypothetical protein F443_15316 [Phytophthora nicotianae P1569]ETL85936.1 hypothetical protein L917_14585 [Phytophthora nicotianae]ETN18984.1 hypothetical protein PPTG_04417 [Phytophthora nicotianae INRA-310]